MKKPFLMLIGVLWILFSCSKGSENTTGGGGGGGGNGGGGGGGMTNVCDNAPKAFEANVNPIIQTFCNQASCHNTGSTNGPGPLTNYTEVFAAHSLIRPAVISGTMPQNTTLTTAQKNTIVCWLDNGAPNN